MRRLLLLSNSTNYGEPYLAWPESHLEDVARQSGSAMLFIPYAGVSITWDDYHDKVQAIFARYGGHLESIHRVNDPEKAIRQASCLVVGGGNTFHLLRHMQTLHLVDAVRERVMGGTPYIGWSAGSNLACPTIKTTNDMPIVEPHSFDGLNLVPFQINPHYTEQTIPDHNGESRQVRLEEFLQVNPKACVVALPEGMLIDVRGQAVNIEGTGTAHALLYGASPRALRAGTRADWLLTNY